MKATIQRVPFLAALTSAASAVPTRTTKPVLQSILVTVDGDDDGYAIGSDLEISVRRRFRGVQCSSVGSALLPTDRILTILRNAIDDEITIEASEEGIVRVHGYSDDYRLTSEDVTLYPTMEPDSNEHRFTIDAAVLKKMVRESSFAIGENETRYALSGSFLSVQPGTVSMTGSDGRRLAISSASIESSFTASAIVPVKPLKIVGREATGEVVVSFDATLITFACEGLTITSRLIEGRYPDYRKVFPTSHAAKATILASHLLPALKQISALTTNECCSVNFEFGRSGITLAAKAMDHGSGKSVVPCTMEGSSVSLAFYPAYVVDYLRSVGDSAEVVASLTGPRDPAVFTCGDSTYVLMPICVQ